MAQEPVLVPKRLLFTPPTTPAPSRHAFTFSQQGGRPPRDAPTPSVQTPQPPQSAASVGSASTATFRVHLQGSASRQASQQVVRYGVPTDPDADEYFTRFAHSNQKRYGLQDLDSDSDSDAEVQGTAAGRTPGSHGLGSAGALSLGTPGAGTPAGASSRISEMSPVESMMHQLKTQWQSAAEVKSAERTSHIHSAFQAADMDLARELAQIQDSITRKQQQVTQAEMLQAKQQLQAREQKLQELQRSHDKAAAQQQEQVAKLQRAAEEEEARQRAEKERKAAAAAAAAAAEAAAKQKAEQEAAAAAAAQQEAEAQAAQAQAAASAAAAQAATAAATQPKAAAGDQKASAAARCMRCAPPAIAFEKEIAKRAEEIQEMVKPILGDDSLKKQRRDIEKKMTVHVQQISATMDQVDRKCKDVYQLIAGQTSPQWQHYAMLMFANKFVKQWELVSLNNKAAFPLAAVLVKVSTAFPALMDLALSILHRECCFTVPCSFATKDAASGAELSPLQLRRLLGYRELDDDTRPGGKMYESDDDFIRRVEGIMYMYGAIVQVAEPRSPHGFDYGWRWLARFLNAIPASRAAAKALSFFLGAAGYGLHQRFRSQFIKLLKCMYDEFLPELARSDEPDIQAVRTLLEHYLVHGQYKEEPEGHNMPRIDMSSYQRA